MAAYLKTPSQQRGRHQVGQFLKLGYRDTVMEQLPNDNHQNILRSRVCQPTGGCSITQQDSCRMAPVSHSGEKNLQEDGPATSRFVRVSPHKTVLPVYMALSQKDNQVSAIDALEQDWDFDPVYAFPPPSLVPTVICKLADPSCRMLYYWPPVGATPLGYQCFYVTCMPDHTDYTGGRSDNSGSDRNAKQLNS